MSVSLLLSHVPSRVSFSVCLLALIMFSSPLAANPSKSTDAPTERSKVKKKHSGRFKSYFDLPKHKNLKDIGTYDLFTLRVAFTGTVNLKDSSTFEEPPEPLYNSYNNSYAEYEFDQEVPSSSVQVSSVFTLFRYFHLILGAHFALRKPLENKLFVYTPPLFKLSFGIEVPVWTTKQSQLLIGMQGISGFSNTLKLKGCCTEISDRYEQFIFNLSYRGVDLISPVIPMIFMLSYQVTDGDSFYFDDQDVSVSFNETEQVLVSVGVVFF